MVIRAFFFLILLATSFSLKAASEEFKDWDTVSITVSGVSESFADAPSQNPSRLFSEFMPGYSGDEGFVDNAREKSIFSIGKVLNKHPRCQVQDATQLPWRSIGHLEFKTPRDYFYTYHTCTGFLVGPRHVLTAAHCVFDYDGKANKPIGWNRNFEFTAARNGWFTKPFGVANWSRVLVPAGYTKHGLREYDMAMIVLDKDIGNDIGYFGFGYNRSLVDKPIDVSGYSGDKYYGTLWHSQCNVSSYGLWHSRFNYTCSTYYGSSGGPVTAFEQNAGAPIVYGVNVAEYLSDDIPYNIAKRIDEVAYYRIRDWLSRY